MNKIYIDLYSKEEEKNSIESKSKFITALKKIKYQLKNMFCHYKVFKFCMSLRKKKIFYARKEIAKKLICFF